MRAARFTRSLLCSAWALLASAGAAWAQAPCPPTGFDHEALLTLKAQDFRIEDARARDDFAEAIVACVADPDPALRDGIAYEAMSTMLRRDEVSTSARVRIVDDLLARLGGHDPNGFEQPFAALLLSEMVRADRVHAWMSADMRSNVLSGAVAYLTALRDYRGFDEAEGWRHGAAHSADVLMQIALNPAYNAADLRRVRDAVATQVAPAGHFYIYGEPERLARPILFIAQRGVFSAEDWQAWLLEVCGPGPLGTWDNVFASQAGLSRRHNLNAFLLTLYANANLSQDEHIHALLPGVEAALRALP